MRSRYAAYFFRRADYIVDTTHPDKRTDTLAAELKETMPSLKWSGLTILSTSKGGEDDKKGKVEFVAEYYVDGEPYELHEHSRFRRYKGRWKYYDAKGASSGQAASDAARQD